MKFLVPAIALTLTLSACGKAPSTDASTSAPVAAQTLIDASADCAVADAGSLCTVTLPEGSTIGSCGTHIGAQAPVCVIGNAG